MPLLHFIYKITLQIHFTHTNTFYKHYITFTLILRCNADANTTVSAFLKVLSSLGYHVVTFDYRGEKTLRINSVSKHAFNTVSTTLRVCICLCVCVCLRACAHGCLCRLGGFRRFSIRRGNDIRRSLYVRLAQTAAGRQNAALHLGTLSGDRVTYTQLHTH